MEELILKASEWFQTDPCNPGLIVSWIKERGLWYVSLVRYTERLGQGKEVIVKTYNRNLQQAIKDLSKDFENYVK